MEQTRSLKIIAHGGGVQTKALYLMSATRIITKADFAIMADPGAEKEGTYKELMWLKKWNKENNGIPIIQSHKKSTIKEDLLNGTNTTGNRFASIPAYTKNDDGTFGMLKRQCTREYKIEVVDKEIRDLYNLIPHQRFPKTEIWMGITLDEIERAKPSNRKEKWKIKVFPFLNLKMEWIDNELITTEKKFFDKPMRRYDCVQWLMANDYTVPPKSACVFCPFQENGSWNETKSSEPETWEKVVIPVDAGIRNSTKKGIRQPIFLHKSCKPINEIDFSTNQTDLFGEECEGYCGL